MEKLHNGVSDFTEKEDTLEQICLLNDSLVKIGEKHHKAKEKNVSRSLRVT